MTYFDNIKYSLINLKKKRFRNILTMIAIIISITTLSLVMFLSSGFKMKIVEYKNSFFNKYPIVITKARERGHLKGKINRYDYATNNKLDNDFVLSLEKFCKENDLRYLNKYDRKITIKNLENDLVFNSYLDENYLKENYILISGKFPKNNHEILLKMDKDYANGRLFDYFGITTKSVNYSDFISKNLIESETGTSLSIVGIIKSKSKLGFDEMIDYDTDFLYKSDLDNIIANKSVYAIYVYGNKEMIKSYISEFSDIKYQDMSLTFEKYLTTILDNIQRILLLFSFISLFISLILIISITYTAGLEREKEIGILKSLGARKVDIRRLFTNETIILSIFSVLISLIFILLIIPFLNKVFYKYTGIKTLMNFSFFIVLKIFIIGILTGLIGSLLPARRNSKKDVIKCLK